MPSQQDSSPPLCPQPDDKASISVRLGRGDIDAKERKRLQNRRAQRTYRQNQKQRLRLLEETIEQVISINNTTNNKSGTTCNSSSTPSIETPATLSTPAQTWSDTTLGTQSSSVHEPWDPTFTFSPIFDSSPTVEPRHGGGGPGCGSTCISTCNNINSNSPCGGRTALHLAVASGNESLVRVLLQHGADVERRDQDGQTALHIACKMGSESLVRLLLEDMVGVDVKDNLGRTALFSAVQSGNEDVVKMLLDVPLDPNAMDTLGNVALHLAVEMGSEPMTLLLLSSGANVDA